MRPLYIYTAKLNLALSIPLIAIHLAKIGLTSLVVLYMIVTAGIYVFAHWVVQQTKEKDE